MPYRAHAMLRFRIESKLLKQERAMINFIVAPFILPLLQAG